MVRQSRQVLIADQSAINREELSKLFQQAGMPVDLTEAATLEDCLNKLKKARKHPFDLALIGSFSDVDQTEMPSRLATLGDETVIVLITDAPNPALFEKALHSAIYDCLIAPVELQDINRVMKRASIPKDPLPILIVDDTRVMRKVVMKVLNESEFSLAISEAESCDMAVSLCRKIPYYCTFLDLNIRVQDGLQTARNILKLQPKCRIVLMSTSDADMRADIEKNGLASFLLKPFYPKDINRLLHTFLGLEQPNLTNPDFLASGGAPSDDVSNDPDKDDREYILV